MDWHRKVNPVNGIRRGQFLFQRQAGLRLGQAQNALAAAELDEVELNFIAVNHGGTLSVSPKLFQ